MTSALPRTVNDESDQRDGRAMVGIAQAWRGAFRRQSSRAVSSKVVTRSLPVSQIGPPFLPIMALVHGSRDVTLWHVGRLFVGEISGLLDLRATTDEMRLALRDVASGAVIVRIQGDPEHWVVIRDALTGRQQTAAHLFTEQDAQLLQLSAEGLSEGEIGQRLHLAVSTVHHQLEQLRHAVGARNRIELAAWTGLHGYYRSPPS